MSTSEAPQTSTPTLSAEEIGKRFLNLLKGLKSRDDLSLERVQEVTGVALKRVSYPKENLESYFHVQPLEGGWSYSLDFILESASLKRGVSLSFEHGKDGFSEMSAVCDLDFEHYDKALKEIGFVVSPVYGEIGQLQSWRYTKFAEGGIGGDIDLSIIPQNVVAGSPGRICVKSIGTLN
ncbi:hypothetical protein FZ025_10755 [Xanthomonas hyacinthi]|uniref:Uncharacterized protein n=1 Tax=Xanthomonas hyacinthi TaxID=56455 RepID=A0A2S7EX40_9XANT|nr:hypothetical protein [Xanthomonas hyacinthi]PPU97715.1 hypothetical protein XhyaCFBP1156_10205 [Xanthomonas hyacinthi]QGY77095.1 hypothetical protein FZ025_10755 [Xanthomonas hyacinthi]